MKLKSLLRKSNIAAGFPVTSKIVVRKMSGGEIAIRNGSNHFTVSPKLFKTMSVKALDGGGAAIVGENVGSDPVEVARFGSLAIAERAHAKLFDAFSLRWTRWVRRAAYGVGGLMLISFLMAGPSGAAPSSHASAELLGPQLAQQLAVQGSSPGVQATASLASTAPGVFSPKLQMPDIAPPALNCAPAN